MAKALSTQRARERALFRYRNALERGDFDTVSEVLSLAQRDAKLVRMIAELHELDDAPTRREQPTLRVYRPQRGITAVHIFREPSPNGWPPKTDTTEEESDMLTISETTMRGHSARLQFLTAIAAAIILIVLGTILIDMANRYIPPQRVAAPLVTPTDAPTIAGCQQADTSDAQGASVRLAGEAETLLEGDAPNAELATLLSICALQTAYSSEGDVALQQVMGIDGAAQTFNGNGSSGGVFSPDGRYLLTGDNTVLRLWDVATGEEIRGFVGHTENILVLAFSPDGRYVLSGSADETARMWDVETGQEIHQFVVDTAGELTVAFSPDGRYILSVGDDPTARLWDAMTGEEIRQFTGHRMPVFGAVFSPDGRYIATSSWDTTVRLWDAATGDELRQFQPFREWAAHVAFSSDGSYLLNSGTYAVRLSDVETGETIREYTAQGSRALGFPSFSPDGRYVLASDRDNRLALLWDAETGELARILDGRVFDSDAGRMLRVNFSPDGRSIVIGTANDYGASPYDRVWLWDTDYRDTIARACQHLTRDFTAEERAQYGLSDGVPTCPQFGENAVLPPGMTPVPTQPIPVWTPLPTAASS